MPFTLPFEIDPLSFGIGFVAASLFWLLVSRMRPALKEWREGRVVRRETAQAKRASGVEENHRRITLRRAQGMHLAAPLFALDEILIPPLLMAPPPRVEPNGPIATDEIVTQTVPYLPAWPEVGTAYHAPTMTLERALSGGSHLVIIGQDGIGKTVALAHLASLLANQDISLGALSQNVPFLIHVADLSLPVKDEKAVLDPIIVAASEQISFLDKGRMEDFIHLVFKSGRAMLLLDGFDELAQDGQKAVVEYLTLLFKTYPLPRVVATALPEQTEGLLEMGFAAMTLLGWNENRQAEFARKWGEHWTNFVSREAWAQTSFESIDPLLLEAWLEFGNQRLTPLEFTLKLWGGFAGDSLGPRASDAIATHIRRVAPVDTPAAALETLALQAVISTQPVFDTRKARDWVRKFEPAEEKTAEGVIASEDGEPSKTGPLGQKKETTTVQTPTSGLLGKMATSGLLLTHQNNHMRFLHPILMGYLAGRAMTAFNAEETLLSQPNWSGKLLAMRNLAAHGDATRLAENLLKNEDRILERPLLTVARWLREAPRESQWRGKVMAGLARVMQAEDLPRGLRGQAMAAFALSGDPGAAAFFRQSLQSHSFELITLAALGSGLMRDVKAVDLLATSLDAPSGATRRAACLALVAIGSQSALEAVANALMVGDDDLRRAAAEALANDTHAGYETLKDGATLPDIIVRRAVAYGLGRVPETWALEILQNLQVQDDQWIVRTAATEVLDSRAPANDPRVPRAFAAPSETPWLIEFAGKQGVGITPGAPATDILLTALRNGTSEERLAALAYLKRTPNEGVIKALYESLHNDDADIREASYQTLWEIASDGASLPNPIQFGLA
ncbi:MAG: HEAT repeat domain-containing protein [Chloroflexi bacterium]|nr:HEAT repeat domain-containing protein [Chloroflexota bacterium]